MSDHPIDRDALRAELRVMSRSDLLIIAERAAELVPRAKLQALLGDFVRLDDLAVTAARQQTLLEAVQAFDADSRRGRYYESGAGNAKSFREHSRGTDAFIAEFSQLSGQCVAAARKAPRSDVREAFECLFGLLRHIDAAHDDVLCFVDDESSLEIGVDWRTVLPAYFRCLAVTASAEEYLGTVDRVIKDFAEQDRQFHLDSACKAASAARDQPIRISRRPR